MSLLNNQTFTLLVRRGLSANLMTGTTFLLTGELAYTTDTQQLYIGNGGDVSGNGGKLNVLTTNTGGFISGIKINNNIDITPIQNSGATLNLTSGSFYIHTGYSQDTWILPLASNAPGRFVFIKNKGNSIILTGNSSTETLFTTSEVLNLTINSGESYIVASNSINQWMIM